MTIFQIGTTLASIYARLAPPTIPRGRLSPPQSSNFVDGKKNRRKFHFFLFPAGIIAHRMSSILGVAT